MFRTEREFFRWLRGLVPSRAQGLRLGIGDDAALVEVARGHEFILTTDMSIEDVHFTSRLHPPRSVGHRALARSLSDIAAMGGNPRFAMVSLALSRRGTRDWIEEFYGGLCTLAMRFGLAVIGGDTAIVSGKTVIDVVVAGEVLKGRALRRSGARPGDQIFVSGRLGVSALGLRLLQSNSSRRWGNAARAVSAHLYPEPRCGLGRFLCRRHLASALIDVSDGLSTDLSHLCEASGVGARVWADRIPGPEVPDAQKSLAASSLDLALHGGEDYQLLFTVPPSKASQVPRRSGGIPIHPIGEIRRSKELILVRPNGKEVPLRPAGYDHFRQQR